MPAFSPAAERNRGPILAVLERLLPARAALLEIASGTGQHAAHFAAAHPEWSWQPSDGDLAMLPEIAAHCAGLANVKPPIHLDVLARPWPAGIGTVDVVLCANLLHIAPWPVCAALMEGAARHLGAAGALVLYGPFIVDDAPTAPSNLSFDADLRRRDPRWGLRKLADVSTEARRVGLDLEERVAMPANNMMLVFRPPLLPAPPLGLPDPL